MQINFARQVIIHDSSHYSQTMKDGGYLFDDLSKWQVYNVEKNELGITRVVLWNDCVKCQVLYKKIKPFSIPPFYST